ACVERCAEQLLPDPYLAGAALTPRPPRVHLGGVERELPVRLRPQPAVWHAGHDLPPPLRRRRPATRPPRQAWPLAVVGGVLDFDPLVGRRHAVAALTFGLGLTAGDWHN